MSLFLAKSSLLITLSKGLKDRRCSFQVKGFYLREEDGKEGRYFGGKVFIVPSENIYHPMDSNGLTATLATKPKLNKTAFI